MSLFDLNTSDEPFGMRVVLSGEIDMSTVEAVESQLRASIDEADGVVAVDLREVNFLDSSGLRLILQLNRELPRPSRRLVVVQGPRRVARVFELTGVEHELEIVADPAEISAG